MLADILLCIKVKMQTNLHFQITVDDVNEAPERVNIYGGGLLNENSPQDTIIGDLNTLDPEPYQTYTYALLSVARG